MKTKIKLSCWRPTGENPFDCTAHFRDENIQVSTMMRFVCNCSRKATARNKPHYSNMKEFL